MNEKTVIKVLLWIWLYFLWVTSKVFEAFVIGFLPPLEKRWKRVTPILNFDASQATPKCNDGLKCTSKLSKECSFLSRKKTCCCLRSHLSRNALPLKLVKKMRRKMSVDYFEGKTWNNMLMRKKRTKCSIQHRMQMEFPKLPLLWKLFRFLENSEGAPNIPLWFEKNIILSLRNRSYFERNLSNIALNSFTWSYAPFSTNQDIIQVNSDSRKIKRKSIHDFFTEGNEFSALGFKFTLIICIGLVNFWKTISITEFFHQFIWRRYWVTEDGE